MKNQKSWFFQVAAAFCFCLVLGALTPSAYAFYALAPGSCPYCNAALAGSMFSAAGNIHYFCDNCNKWSYVSTASPLRLLRDSGVISSEVSEPSCTSPGQIRYSCSLHGDSISIPTGSPLGHSWSETAQTTADCVTPGFIEETCSRCSMKNTVSIPALGHDFQETSRTSPTCTASGTSYQK